MVLLNISDVTTQLNISKASIKNWEKHGYIKQIEKNLYHPDDVKKLHDLDLSGTNISEEMKDKLRQKVKEVY